MLRDQGIEYSITIDESKIDYPTLYDEELSICGFIAIAEYLSGGYSGIRKLETNNSIQQGKRVRYQIETERKEANRRMWLFVILNEVWYGAGHGLMHERVLRVQSGHAPDYYTIRQSRSKLKAALSDINSWFIENIYIVDLSCYTDTLLASILAFLDYLSEVDWDLYPNLKGWYIAFKSKPSFQQSLDKIIPGHKPPAWYKLLDF